MTTLEPTALVPVAQWIYHRYLVKYWTANPEEGGTVFSDGELVSTDNNVEYRIQDRWPGDHCTYYTVDVLEENVAPPPVIGQLYGTPIHSNGWVRYGKDTYNAIQRGRK